MYFVFAIFVMGSCQQEEACYSCDENVDAYIKAHLKSIQEMDRAEIITHPNEMQRVMFRVLSPTKKKEVWLDKFVQLNSLDLNEAERILMKKFHDFVIAMNFEDDFSDKDIAYLESLREEVFTKHGWTQRFVVGAFGYLENVDSNGIILVKEIGDDFVITDPNSDKDCDCRWGFACLDGPCDERKGVCKRDDDSGCGWFFLEKCTGLCRPNLG